MKSEEWCDALLCCVGLTELARRNCYGCVSDSSLGVKIFIHGVPISIVQDIEHPSSGTVRGISSLLYLGGWVCLIQ